MADKEIKIGTTSADSIMFAEYKAGTANEEIFFGSLIPVDNSDAATKTASKSVWQVNDGWEVEIISPKKIAIKKFKIDTWGLRQITTLTINDPIYSNFKVNVSGLSRVHNEVICHTAGSDVPDGFTNAYGGTGGYNVYWYPGQFTSGYYMKGLVIQFGIGYSANDNQRADGLQMGKFPWDVKNKTGITDGTVTGTSAHTSFKAITIGLFGGVQNAASWHDETGDAYRQYDISDKPIYIDLDVPDITKEIDPTSVECWDVYCGDTQLYHKDKTLENCWKKYGLVFPKNWRLVRTNFAASDYVQWFTPTKFRIKSVPSGRVTISVADDNSTSDSDNKSNYVNINWKQFVVKLSQELPAGVTVKVVRGLGNAYYGYDNATGVYSNPVSDIETVLSVGENTIAALNTEIHRKSSDATMSFNECRIVISSSAAVEDVDCYVEIVPPYADGEVLTVNESYWNLDKVKVPAITDLEEHIDNLTFNINPANADFWTPVKEYYKTNVFKGDAAFSQFYNAQNLDELELTLPDTSWLSYDYTFKHSSIKKLTLTGQENTCITSLNGIFEGLGNLTELVVNVDDEHDGDYLAGANDCSNMFNWCGLPTYPSNFICWNAFRTNAAAFSKKATTAHSMFWYAAIEAVPNYGTDADADANTILCGTASGMFYKCDDLVTVGPIADLQLIKPTGGENIFVDCTKLTTIRIKNLNHGNWHFDNTEFESGKKHGTLEALDASSIQYLFSNLADLNNYDADKNVSTINNDFLKWSSAYTTHGVYSSDYDYKFASASSLVLKKRFASQAEASFIVYTTSSAIDISFTVYGLADGDSLLFGAGGSSAADYTITEDGTYTVKKTDTLTKGFMLVNSDTSVESDVTVTLNKGWDLSVPSVSTAELHCPAEWEENVTDDMVTAANAKGWSVYIGGTIKEVS